MSLETQQFLQKVAKKAAGGKLPSVMTLGQDPGGDVLWELNKILHGHVSRTLDGKLKVSLSGELADPLFWKNLVSLPEESPTKSELFERALKRLVVENPEAERFVSIISENQQLKSFVSNSNGNAAALRTLFKIVQTDGLSTTLSQLGSDYFNDSKYLRNGSALAALVNLLKIIHDIPEDEDISNRDVLARFGIEENPYTSSVTVFAPFSFVLKNDDVVTFPEEMFSKGLAVQLPLETVREIREIRHSLDSGFLNTSENAAPFSKFVEKKSPCIYIGGYPNSAVCGLLDLFSAAGLTVRHYGDTDLDGRLIAVQVFSHCGGEMVEPAENSATIPLTESAAKRLEAWLAGNRVNRFYQLLEKTLHEGWVEQESILMC